MRTLPKVLKYLPSDKAQDARNYVNSLQYWLGGNDGERSRQQRRAPLGGGAAAAGDSWLRSLQRSLGSVPPLSADQATASLHLYCVP